ncbi:LAMI_0H04896g1_1 [Lachancea mirantina]|uniref:LAMI_0H04896g1_1 n=1 Tax=Lachancea mirantina TaxID=1230905 RepID=A0A1G4KEW5_9SACH|nr:LAMI_0H04896g1_1 [Lachancea mirantina]
MFFETTLALLAYIGGYFDGRMDQRKKGGSRSSDVSFRTKLPAAPSGPSRPKGNPFFKGSSICTGMPTDAKISLISLYNGTLETTVRRSILQLYEKHHGACVQIDTTMPPSKPQTSNHKPENQKTVLDALTEEKQSKTCNDSTTCPISHLSPSVHPRRQL